MLEGKSNDILHSLEGRRAIGPGEPFSNDDPNPTVHLTSVPMSLLQDLMMERGKAKVVLVTIFIDFCYRQID